MDSNQRPLEPHSSALSQAALRPENEDYIYEFERRLYQDVQNLIYAGTLYQTTSNLQEFSYSPFTLNYPLRKNLDIFG